MSIAERVDEYGKPAWITLMVLSFIAAWPVGLAVLAFLIGSGRMGCGRHAYGSWWHHEGHDPAARLREKAERWMCRRRGYRPSGNRAFDEYRAETLRRLEDEQREFMEFLDQLRFAKDKAEFDDFLSQRRNRPEPPPEAQQP